jgi:hypothetical protein
LQSLKISQFVGRGASTAQRSSGSLIGNEVLREEEPEGAARLGFEDPFFPQGIGSFAAKAAGLLLP